MYYRVSSWGEVELLLESPKMKLVGWPYADKCKREYILFKPKESSNEIHN
jgi:hypothetical protein